MDEDREPVPEMEDYISTEEEIYANGWRPDPNADRKNYLVCAPPRRPNHLKMDAQMLHSRVLTGICDENGKITEEGIRMGFSQRYLDGTETWEDVRKQNAIRQERFKLTYGFYFGGDKHAVSD